jgi:hypothetical protein
MIIARIAGVLTLVGLSLGLAACVSTEEPLLVSATTVQPLYEETLVVNNENLHVARHVAQHYVFDRSSQELMTAVFVPLEGAPGFYILRTQDRFFGYVYSLAEIRPGQLLVYSGDDAAVAKEAGIDLGDGKPSTIIAPKDDGELLRFMAAAYRHRGEAKFDTYRLLDFADGTQSAEASRLVAAYDQAHPPKSDTAGAAAPKQQTVAPAGPQRVGAWQLESKADPMTDAKIYSILGVPDASLSSSDQAYLKVECHPDGLRLGLYWGGSALQDMYPNGDLDFADVTMRFDDEAAFELGWTLSPDGAFTGPPDETAGAVAQLGQGFASILVPDAGKINMVWKPETLHTALKLAHRLALRASTRSGTTTTLVFDTAGYAALASAFPAYCGG